MDDKLIARFWSKVDKRGADECWPWLGTRDKDGYGNTYVRGRTTRSHRIAWEFANGPIPKDAHILHRCDNPPCCNAAHLFDGTAVANVEDMVAKRRQARGERQHLARLTAANRYLGRCRGLSSRRSQEPDSGVDIASLFFITR